MSHELMRISGIVISSISIIACSYILYIYRRLNRKSLIMKNIAMIGLFDFFLALSYLLYSIEYGRNRYPECWIWSTAKRLFYYCSIFAGSLLALISYKLLSSKNYDAEPLYYKGIIGIVLFSLLYIVGQYFLPFMEVETCNEFIEKSDDAIFLVFYYLPIFLAILLTIGTYIMIGVTLKKNFDEEELKARNIKFKYLTLNSLVQIVMYLPFTIYLIYQLMYKQNNVPGFLLILDYFASRLIGAFNTIIYLLIRIRKPELLKANFQSTLKTATLLLETSEIAYSYSKSNRISRVSNLRESEEYRQYFTDPKNEKTEITFGRVLGIPESELEM